jgi:hypothetical protein
MSMSRKAESSVEFMALFGILMVFFVLFLGFLGNNSLGIRQTTVFQSARNVLDTSIDEINIASRIDGYHKMFNLPDALSEGYAYSLSYNNSMRTITITWNGGIIVGSMTTGNMTGSLHAGDNTISNTGGKVTVNEG